MPTELLTALETLGRALAEVKRSTLLSRLQPGLEPATTRAVLAEQGFSPRKDVEDLFSWHNGTATDQILPMDDIHVIPGMYFLNLEGPSGGWRSSTLLALQAVPCDSCRTTAAAC